MIKMKRTWYYSILATILMMKGIWSIDVGAGGLIVGYNTINFFGNTFTATSVYHMGIVEIIVSWIALLYLVLFHYEATKE